MNKKMQLCRYYISDKIRSKQFNNISVREYVDKNNKYAGLKINSSNEINRLIYDKIVSGEKLLVSRFGGTELSTVKIFDFGLKTKYEKIMNQLYLWSGFFPNNIKLGMNFTKIMKESMQNIDILGVWFLPFEDYYIKNNINNKLEISYLFDIEPWSSNEIPWTKALENKKVLVIHPFVDSIKEQYMKREKLFPGTDILPKFDLITLKAVQTIAGEKDDRFDTWFEALEFMYNEAIKIDFDIAIIGCGAYGLPLASMLKDYGKQAIHLGGATQLLFGIKGKRWSEERKFEYVRKYFNDSWIYPNTNDKPKNAQKVESGCYW